MARRGDNGASLSPASTHNPAHSQYHASRPGTNDSPSHSYRTNIFGFLASKDLSAQDPDGLSGNYGLYDCVSMFEWVRTVFTSPPLPLADLFRTSQVQKNIGAFGGDISNVTAFGQSAGAFMVSYLLVSGKRLFNKAICQSGAATTMAIRPVEAAYPATPVVLSSLSVPPSATASERLAALRAAPAETLLSLHIANHSFAGLSLALEPEGKGIWTKNALSRLRRGEWDEWVEGVVLGTTEDEGSVFAWGLKVRLSSLSTTPSSFFQFFSSIVSSKLTRAPLQLTSLEAFQAYLLHFPPPLRSQIANKYFPSGSTHPAPDDFTTSPGSLLLADQIFVNPVWDQAVALSGGENEEGKKVKTWMYRLTTGVEMLLKFSPIKLGIMYVSSASFLFFSLLLPVLLTVSSLPFPPWPSTTDLPRLAGTPWTSPSSSTHLPSGRTTLPPPTPKRRPRWENGGCGSRLRATLVRQLYQFDSLTRYLQDRYGCTGRVADCFELTTRLPSLPSPLPSHRPELDPLHPFRPLPARLLPRWSRREWLSCQFCDREARVAAREGRRGEEGGRGGGARGAFLAFFR